MAGCNQHTSSQDNEKKKKKNESLEKVSDISSIQRMLEIVKGAKEFNIPTIRASKKLVGYVNRGLQDPSALIFGNEKSQPLNTKFNYPSLSGIYRPKNDDDITLTFRSSNRRANKDEANYISGAYQNFYAKIGKENTRYNHVLEVVVTYTEELANQQAKDADELLAQGVYLGHLHMIPYGLKDIISVPHYKTTWGSTTFKDQVLNTEAWVYKRLKSARVVLVAKLVTGSLAYDDIWFGGRTRNPWNIEEFTTGSSSGHAACTSAGKVPFVIGSKTVGSMTLPATRCGVAALRPTFGSVGRTGVMSLSESLDKLGPVCRSVADCAVVLDAIRGNDPDDLSSRDIPLEDPFSIDITKLTVRYVDDTKMEAQRARGRLIREVRDNFSVDAFIGDAVDWERVCMGNLVGMPVIVGPAGFTNIYDPPCSNCLRKTAMTTGIYAPPHQDHIALALAMAYQSVPDHHKKRHPIDDLGPNDSISIPPKVA
ncbi:hypothetical protein DVH24_039899 [Malus domestica]|uniref:Amidase domain-containing protein n=1 Tax=Malus domestica TaxID=3750 RepID=A0A498I298_MALDO|nr:hypothetical protein DVH24_039899 [Malus domestica]